ncbi:MAG: NAD(P)-binding domain-containing protein [Candidatus Lokiarchaeota archaeon]|nr:NAD(P)-binding domain-containing protein [Candidatus Harpocratesius repetitus]
MGTKFHLPTIYLTSPVFFEIANHPKVSKKFSQKIMYLRNKLEECSNLKISAERFPSTTKIIQDITKFQVDFIGCHISHPIKKEIMEIPTIKAVCTSTVGYDHVQLDPRVLITHTPSILHKSVADFTIALILANLRNLNHLHNFLWEGNWERTKKWDLDENLTNILDNLTVGIIGLGEIGTELVKRLAPWGIRILYYDLNRNSILENKFTNLKYYSDIKEVLQQSQVISLHVPLNSSTKGMISEKELRLLQPNTLLVNTARGAVIDFSSLINLLKKKEISIHLAFDVYPEEPINPEILEEFKIIQKMRPELRFIFIPHNASSDADTRAQMSIMMLEDLLTFANSHKPEDLRKIHLIPELRNLITEKNLKKVEKEWKSYRIWNWWYDSK